MMLKGIDVVVGDILGRENLSGYEAAWRVEAITDTHLKLQVLGSILPPITVYRTSVTHLCVTQKANSSVITVRSVDYMNNDELNLEDKAIITEALQC